MFSVRTLLRNIASNWAGYAVQVVVAFLLTPFVLRSLGQSGYGIWTLATGLTGYYGLLDLGFSAGITQYLTRYIAAKDSEKLNQTGSTGVVALTGCGLLVLFSSVVIALNAGRFQVPAESAHELGLVIFITGASIAIQFSFFTYSAVFTAVQRFDLSNAIGVSTRIASAITTVILLKQGYGLIGLTITMASTNLLDYLI